MTNSPVGRGAAELLAAAPVISDDDVLGRVAAVIGPAARNRRTLWLLFLERDGTQADRVVPVDCLPGRPGAAAADHVCYLASESVARAPGVSVVITLTASTTYSQRTSATAADLGMIKSPAKPSTKIQARLAAASALVMPPLGRPADDKSRPARAQDGDNDSPAVEPLEVR